MSPDRSLIHAAVSDFENRLVSVDFVYGDRRCTMQSRQLVTAIIKQLRHAKLPHWTCVGPCQGPLFHRQIWSRWFPSR